MLLKIIMVLLILSLGKSFLENRTAVPLAKGPWQTANFLNINDIHETNHFDDFMDQEQIRLTNENNLSMEQEQFRLSNPYETQGVDTMIDHDYHGMGNGID